jgi:catecholate siderophore receptor
LSKPAFLALSCVGFIASAPAYAAGTEADPQAQRANEADSALGEQVLVTGERQRTVESPKATQPLLDTPQTVTVISDQVLRKQNLLTLRDALTVIPGITFGAGEGGGGYGDSINLRGYSANTDITVDGVRDSAQYSRTDPFNLQQIEVYNGANSVFNGSGSVGGTINLVTKTPRAENLTIVQAGIGTDNYYRGAVDTNQRVSDLVAVRVNAMIHRNDYPGRDVEKFKRWGVAPSITIGIDRPTSLTLGYVHQHDDNVPLYGVPWFRGPVNDGRIGEIDDSDYFGYRNLDFQKTTLDRLSATFSHDFSPDVSVRNLTRWQRVRQDSVTSAPQGTFCLSATGLQPVGGTPTATTGLPCVSGAVTIRGSFLPSGPRGLTRDQENQLLYNQTDLRWTAGEKGGVRNILNIGVQAGVEDYNITSGSLLRTVAGVAVAPLPFINLANPDSMYAGPLNYFTTAISKSETKNLAVYAFDTLELGRFELNGGIRWEKVEQTFRAVPLLAYPAGVTPLTALQTAPQVSDDTLLSYRVGAVFKPTARTSIYAAFGNAKTPSSATVRLGCGVLSAPGAADPCAVKPETAKNYEIGVKADVRGVQLTAAAFRNERSNFRTPSNDPAQPAALQVLDGRSRVDGIALGATGSPIPGLTIFANYTYLDGKVLQSVSDFCLANPSVACANTAAVPDPQKDQRLLQTPKHSGSLFASYKFPFGLELGYGLTYQGRFALNNRVAPTVAATNLVQYYSDDYLTQRALVSYTLREGVTVQLNVQNLFDRKYYTNIRNNVSTTTGAITGGWALPGERRSAVLSLFYSF